jgi:MFS family permease
MSGEAAGEHPPTEEAPRPLGVIATWRQTSGQVKALLAGVFVSRLAGFLQIFLVLFMTHRGFTPGQAGLALGLYGAGAVLGSFAGGYLSDRLSARTATLISMFGSAVLIISILYIKIYFFIVLAVVLVSTIGQLCKPASQSLITELTPPSQLVMVTAMYRLCLNLGTTVTPLIGVALVSISYNLLFWAEALAAVTYALIALNFLPKRADTPPPPAAGQHGPKTRTGYLAVLTDARYVAYLAAVLLVTVVYCQYTAALPLAIVKAGLSLWWYSAVVSVNAIIVATCEVGATRFVQTWPMRLTALSGFGLVAIGYGMYAISLMPLFLILGTLIWTMSEIIGAPTTFAYPGMVAPPHLRGRYAGAMLSTFGLGNAIGPILGVALWNQIGQRFWLVASGVAILSALAALIGMHRPTPASASSAPSASAPAAEAAG